MCNLELYFPRILISLNLHIYAKFNLKEKSIYELNHHLLWNLLLNFSSNGYRIENESSNYRLWVGGYSGNATDSLSAHNGYPFSTVDRNNDEAPKCCPCAPAYGGGWWFYRYPMKLLLEDRSCSKDKSNLQQARIFHLKECDRSLHSQNA